MDEKVKQALKEACEANKLVRLKLRYAGEDWAGWIRGVDAVTGKDYCICSFERLLDPKAYESNGTNTDTVPQTLPSFWIEDVKPF